MNWEAIFHTSQNKQNNVEQNDLIAQSDHSVIFLPSYILVWLIL